MRSLLLALVLLTSTAQADNVEMWLEKMNQSIHELTYTGTYVHINNDQIDTMQIVHRADEEGERERLLSLNGEAREILRDSEKVTCILPADQSVIIGHHKTASGLPALVPSDAVEYGRNYNIDLIGRDRVAGYPTVILSVVPKDRMRYGYRIWLEEDSGMVLRSDIMDSNARVIEQMMFTEISFQTPVTNEMLEPTVAHDQFRVITEQLLSTESEASAGMDNWSFVKIPEGFRIADMVRLIDDYQIKCGSRFEIEKPLALAPLAFRQLAENGHGARLDAVEFLALCGELVAIRLRLRGDFTGVKINQRRAGLRIRRRRRRLGHPDRPPRQ